jgi:ATP-binding protein involved in chromosome partitioning
MELPLLAQIPVVQDICQSGDEGVPAATDPAGMTGQAFMQLAARIVTENDKRRAQLPPTKIVGLKS